MWAILVKPTTRDNIWLPEKYNSYEDAEKALPQVKAEHGLEAKYYIVSKKQAFPPDIRPRNRKHWWCPYCRAWRKFIKRGHYTKCSVCEITVKEHYVIKYNNAEFLQEHFRAMEAEQANGSPEAKAK